MDNEQNPNPKEDIKALVTKYEAEKSSGKINRYTEEDIKKGFILPLFEALGWDPKNRDEVSSEEHIKSSGRVDYGFYLDDRPKFYLEAKSAKADIHDEQWARQAIRYSWNKGVTWAVLTNFEHLLVFNAQDTKSSLYNKLLFDIPFTKFISRFDDVWLLSKQSFAENALDAYAERIGKKFQRVPISAQLYKDLDECREILTRSLSAWNKDKLAKNPTLLDEGVQKLLDRLIFIRVAEDRAVEPPTLIPLLREWQASKSKNETPLYASMVSKFRELDKVYNSNLFSEHPFEAWEEFDGSTEKAIKILYGKEGYYDYDFKAMPADVLGTVYENYLGHRLLQSKKGVTLDEDAGKRKEQGIYYTPSFVVDYIVKHSLQPVLDKCKTLDELRKVKVLDPACGSGSFLIKALEVLNDKYKELGEAGDETTKLQILTYNIFGVDLDEQAVEIARLNLCINSLDGKMKLPYLTDNIKCGNSLISGTDAKLKQYFGVGSREKRPFNWEEEFPSVFEQGGFDVMVGNPPWVFTRGENFSDSEKSYFDDFLRDRKIIQADKGKNIQSGKLNLYSLFILRSVDLLKDGGTVGFIVPNNILRTTTFDVVRKYILDTCGIVLIADLGTDIFQGVTAASIVIVLRKESVATQRETNMVKIVSEISDLTGGDYKEHEMAQSSFYQNTSFGFNILSDSRSSDVTKQIEVGTVKLGSLCKYIIEGIVGSRDRDVADEKLNELYRPFLVGKDIGRYKINYKGKWICYDKKRLHRARPEEVFLSRKILIQRISGGNSPLVATLDEDKFFTFASINNLVLKDGVNYEIEYILALINSSVLNWYYSTNYSNRSALTVNVSKTFLEQLPIKEATKAQQQLIAALSSQMLQLNKELQKVEENSNEWERLKSEIEKTDGKITEAVCKLYNVTKEDLKIAERATISKI